MIDKKFSQAMVAAAVLTEIVSEKYFAGILPETRKIAIKELNEITIYNYFELKKYLGNNIYRIRRKPLI